MTPTHAILADITYKRVRILSGDQVKYNTFSELPLMPGTDDVSLLVVDDDVKTHFVSVHQICRAGRPDVVMAYSKKLQNMFGLPYDVMARELDELSGARRQLQHHIKVIDTAPILQRLKYLFTGDAEDLI